MASKDYLIARNYAAEDIAVRIEADGPKAFRIREIHGGASTPTVALSSTSSTLTLTDSDGAATVIDLSAGAYNTMGEVVDYINTLDNWECKILDCLRSDATDNVMVDGSVSSATAENGETIWDVPMDTSASFSLTYRCAYDREFPYKVNSSKERTDNRPAGSHRVNLSQFKYYADVSAATENSVQIFKYDPISQAETQIWGATSVDSTATTHTFTDPLTGGDGKDLIVRVKDGTSLSDTAAYLEVEYSRE